MSFSPHRVVSQLASNPELAVLTVLDEALKQAIGALLTRHPDIGLAGGEFLPTSSAGAIINRAWDLRNLIRSYRAALARERRRRYIPF